MFSTECPEYLGKQPEYVLAEGVKKKLAEGQKINDSVDDSTTNETIIQRETTF